MCPSTRILWILALAVLCTSTSSEKICPYADCQCNYHDDVDLPSRAMCDDVNGVMPSLEANYTQVDTLLFMGNVSNVTKEDLPANLSELQMVALEIYRMTDDALENSAKSLRYLSLRIDEWFDLPSALLRLENLKKLSIMDEDLFQAYNETVLEKLGQTVTTLDLRFASAFPGEKMRFFKNLRHLDLRLNVLYGTRNLTFDEEIFDSLLTLNMSLHFPEEPPKVLGKFNKLTELFFETYDFKDISDFGNLMSGSSQTLKSISFIDCIMTGRNDYSALENLEVFISEHSQLPEIPTFFPNSQLRELKLGFNKIKRVSDDSLKGMSQLTFLDLSGNDITTVSENAFTEASSLKSVWLDSNKLTQVPLALARAPFTLRTVLLSYNPIECGCTPHDLHDWVVKERSRYTSLYLDLPGACEGGTGPETTVESMLWCDSHICKDDVIE